MTTLLVVDNPAQWPLSIPGAELVSAREYLTDRRFVGQRRAKVFNLCRSYGYQTAGYYVSLLAAARGHKPLPSVTTLQDLRHASVVRIASENLEELIQRTLAPIKSERFVLSIYFGRNLASRHDRLAQALFNHFPVPLLRAEFVRLDHWRLHSLRPISSSEIPESHREFVIEQAHRFFARPRLARPARARYDLAILLDPDESDPPSDERAIKRFMRAAERQGMAAWTIDKQDIGRIAEYDGLFIRVTTSVNHYTYRFARRAEAEGLVVIDDPESIVRCSNKVYLAELFERHQIPAPRTLVVHQDNRGSVADTLGLPCVLKRPDSSFSAGVEKARDPQQLEQQLDRFFEDSELVVAQEMVPSAFDWRVGVLAGRALYVCRYYMAPGHWKIQKAPGEPGRKYGKVETLPLEEAPEGVVDLGVRAASLIGNGLYGVDIKQVGDRFLVIEVNDNPSIEAGCEDAVIKDGLYDAVMGAFYERMEGRQGRRGEPR